jgi:hypothetical protein
MERKVIKWNSLELHDARTKFHKNSSIGSKAVREKDMNTDNTISQRLEWCETD